MTPVKSISLTIFILFDASVSSELCPASGNVQTVLHESPLFRDVKPKSQSLKQMTTSGRLQCAVNCYHRPSCRSIFYSTTDNICLLYGDDVFHSASENYTEMRRFDVENDVPADCYDVVMKGIQTDGIYLVKPRDGGQPISVYCEITNGGWLVFQRRTDGSVDFYRTWNEYKDGFGNLSNEFWLGNTNIHRLTTQGLYELRVDLEDFVGSRTYASYKNFSIAGEDKNFQLSVANYSGTAGDGLEWHNGCNFSTKDKDVDKWSSDCAKEHRGAWWYRFCVHSNLNGIYRNANETDPSAIWWSVWRNNWDYTLKRTVMKIRPSKFVP